MKQFKQLYTVFSEPFMTSDPPLPLPEYPRPSLVRKDWTNLNGFWEYAITCRPQAPVQFDGRILVPFSPECALSGVKRQVGPKDYLWYRRTFPSPLLPTGYRLWLHFGAVDQCARIFINGSEAGSHSGGYLPFSVDITSLLTPGDNELLVQVQDASDTSWHSRGKQKLRPGGMFYTAQSGIWQTVWTEIVPENAVRKLLFTPDLEQGLVHIKVLTPTRERLVCTVGDQTDFPVTVRAYTNEDFTVTPHRLHPWTPETPYLYPVSITVGQDHVRSYFALRQCDIRQDAGGKTRFFLNGRPYFQTGVLDQGYWPESLYTPPSDEALIFDIIKMKELGFNMLRKHAKIEPERFYYHCDRLGMLVWQDMVNGGSSYKHWFVTYLATLMNWTHISFHDGPRHQKLLSRGDEAGREEFLSEVDETVSFLYNHPCIVVWVPFNEGWGQFDALSVTERIHGLDPGRLIDHASGWFDQKGGDILSLHYYFFTLRFRPENGRATALTEFGGYCLSLPEHAACPKTYGYRKFKTTAALTEGYKILLEQTILPAARLGVGATVYTQLSDIEEETNGIYTWDRKICKLDAATILYYNNALKELI